jgi:tol-pal system protein YbgF
MQLGAPMLWWCVTALLLWGCGASAEDVAHKQLQESVHQLQAQVARQDGRLEDLNNRLLALSTRVAPGAGAGTNGHAHAEPTPPPNLQVVRLQPKADAAATAGALAEDPEEPPVELTLRGSEAAYGSERVEVVAVPPIPADVVGPSIEAQTLFGAGLDAYRAGDFASGHTRFAEYVRRFPKAANAASARYWMGECRFERREYRLAIREYEKLLTDYPQSRKIPDALLKLGLAHERLGAAAQAKEYFRRVVASYPDSALAELARARLSADSAGSAGKDSTP